MTTPASPQLQAACSNRADDSEAPISSTPWQSWAGNAALSANQRHDHDLLPPSSTQSQAPFPFSELGPIFASTGTGNGSNPCLKNTSKDLFSLSKRTTSSQLPDAKALAASKSHSEAERRRRERINKHLATLRTLLPNTAKTDKASLLAEVIERIKELKQQVAQISSEFGPVPSDVDELNVDVDSSCPEGKLHIKASICCDDRPGLLTDLVRTLKNLRLRTVKAEMATMEGRTKNVFIMTIKEEQELLEPTLACIQDALRAVMEESAALPPDPSTKRPRVNSPDGSS